MSDETNRTLGQTLIPESFPPELLVQPVGARLEYFEQRCLISHPRLQEALETIIQAVTPPGEGASTRRPGTMVLVIGPSRVGKTTLIRLLEEQLLARTKALMVPDPSFIPFASITASGSDSSRFEWSEYYRAVLRALDDPFVDGKIARIRTKELREAMETALLERKPLAIIVDEAHHLAEAASGSRLVSQLNNLKHFENATGVSHILVGTYEMRPFRKVNAQLACRSIDVHFPRYDATIEQDAQVFQSVVWALQRQLPVEKEPPLLNHWEFLYARSIGCIGLLKMHLNRALNLALTEKAKTITLAHLRKTALSEAQVELALRNALESEAELAESEGADERLLTLLGLRGGRELQSPKTQEEEQGSKPKRQGRRGTRAPNRDSIESKPDEASSIPLINEEQAAG
ncbi:MAG: ATP-binding protein [Chloroflexi bacterium]|nr:MAG: ATP-binding protein [Chloroflexota bacterium]